MTTLSINTTGIIQNELQYMCIDVSTHIPKATVATTACNFPDNHSEWIFVRRSLAKLAWYGRTFKPFSTNAVDNSSVSVIENV